MIQYKYILYSACPTCGEPVEWGVYSVTPGLKNGREPFDYLGCRNGCPLSPDVEKEVMAGAKKIDIEEYFELDNL